MDESFTLDDIELNELEEAAQLPNRDDITVCSCKGLCLRGRGRNACPCKAIEQYCTSACHPSEHPAAFSIACMNTRQILESDTSDSDLQEDQSVTSEHGHFSEVAQEPSSSSSRRPGLSRGRGGRGRRRGRSAGRSSGRGEGRGEALGRGQRRAGRRQSGKVRGSLTAEDNAEQRLADQEQQLQNLVANLEVEVLRRLAAELLRRQPAVFADLVNWEMAEYHEPHQPVQPHPDPGTTQIPPVHEPPQLHPGAGAPQQHPGPETLPPPGDLVPDWCHCGLCRTMPTQAENKCCCNSKMQCISTTTLFHQLVLDANVLDLAMRYREDVLALDHPRNNENFRHTAYRQYVLWQHGRLGQGNRRVVPSCCVLAIRRRYPSASGLYTGFRPARL